MMALNRKTFQVCVYLGICLQGPGLITGSVHLINSSTTSASTSLSTDVDECRQYPCGRSFQCINTVGSFRCLCPPGFSGRECKFDINECTQPSDTDRCFNNGTCENTIGSYKCACANGWTGTNCAWALDVCKSQPCKNRGTCVNQVGSYRCECYDGYTGWDCETDINECEQSGAELCLNNGTCVNTNGSFTCMCTGGWSSVNCSSDLDECALWPCKNNGSCVNTVGSYLCRCDDGYAGPDCVADVNECEENETDLCFNNGTCVNTNGSYYCMCAEGWTGYNCTSDLDECVKNPCNNNAFCVNTVGSYNCVCRAGYTGSDCVIDINECEQMNETELCLNNGTCVNTYGHWKCACAKGWTGVKCTVDLNECVQRPCKNEGECLNTMGSYHCNCHIGYTGSDCGTDINECDQSGIDICFNNGTCTNTYGSYTCICADGWNGVDCSSDVNECGSHPCKNTGVCVNIPGSYRCDCPAGYSGKDCGIAPTSPNISAEVSEVSGQNELFFYCNFDPVRNTDYFYTVHWYLLSDLSSASSLILTSETRKYNTSFREESALAESQLSSLNITLPLRLACSVSIRFEQSSTPGPGIFSKYEFYGIQVVNSTSLWLNGAQAADIYLKLTVPFGCQINNSVCHLDVNVFMPRSNHCEMADVGLQRNLLNPCGLRFLNNETGILKPLKLQAVFAPRLTPQKRLLKARLVTQLVHDAHPLFQDHLVSELTIRLQTDSRILSGKRCYSHNDPHMMSFDGLTYENQNEGTFILYQNKKYNIQDVFEIAVEGIRLTPALRSKLYIFMTIMLHTVQIQTSKCPNWRSNRNSPWCNCGVAVAAGRDVFVVSKCNKNAPWDIGFKTCDDNTLKDKILSRGSVYNVNLPTGGGVHIFVNGGYTNFLNVDVTPSIYDYGVSEGLCGIFDGRNSNDRQERPGSMLKDPNLSWRLNNSESLFLRRNDKNLKPYGFEEYLCSCGEYSTVGQEELANNVLCYSSKVKICKDSNFEVTNLQAEQCSVSGKNKSRGPVDKHSDSATSVENGGPNTMATSSPLPLVPPRYTYKTARRECLERLNTTVFRLCETVPDLDVEPYIDSCAKDAVLTDSMVWAQTHLEGVKDHCKHQIQVNQPLPPEVIADKTFAAYANETGDLEVLVANQSVPEAFTPEFLTRVEDLSCPNDCSDHGNCINGSCKCHAKFAEDDCSVDVATAPVVYGIPDEGLCDLTSRACSKTSVYGDHFVASENLLCNITAFEITASSTVHYSSAVKLEATRLSFAEVVCSLHEVTVRSKRNVKQTAKDTFIARGYDVSISNDGVHFSVADSIIIFDSTCVNCTKVGKNIFCVKDPEFCMWNNRCFGVNDTADCEICKQINDVEVAWLGDPECMSTRKLTTVTSSQEHKTSKFITAAATRKQTTLKRKTTTSAQQHPTATHKTTFSAQERLTTRLTTAETKTPTPQDAKPNRLVGAVIGSVTFGLIITMIIACLVYRRNGKGAVISKAKSNSRKGNKDWTSAVYTKEMDTFEAKE